MFRKIISTVFIRAFLAGLSFFLAILTTQYLGPAGKGDVSLFVLNLTIVQLVCNFVGGPYIVYLVPRKNIMHLLLLSYAWALAASVLIPIILLSLNLLEQESFFHLIFISIIFSFISINTQVMIGKEEVNKYNITSLIQAVVLMVAFFIYIEIFKIRNLSSYINAMYFSCITAIVVSFILIGKYFDKISLTGILKTLEEALKKGVVLQAGSIAQMFNYRLSFYILDHFHSGGRKEVGIYSVAVSVAEALWLIAQSVSLVLYARISNSEDIVQSQRLTVALIKIVSICTLLSTAVLFCVPQSVFTFVFGSGFEEVKRVMFPLSAGIIMLSAGIILSSYFVGTGKPQVTVTASIMGLAITIACGFILIPTLGMVGAGITASASYAVSVIFQFIKFMQEAKKIDLADFIFTKSDFKFVFLEVKNMFTSKQVQ